MGGWGGLFRRNYVFVLDRACPGDIARTFIVVVYCILDKNQALFTAEEVPIWYHDAVRRCNKQSRVSEYKC